MPLQIPLAPIPNQSLDVVLENDAYTLRFTACIDGMSVDIRRNGVDVIVGSRLVAGEFLIPYPHQYYGKGNFTMVSGTDDIPYYDQFGVSQLLMYNTKAEIEAARATA